MEEVGEWNCLVKFATKLRTVGSLRLNFAIQPFTKEIPWPSHRLFINGFYRVPNVLREENVVKHDMQHE